MGTKESDISDVPTDVHADSQQILVTAPAQIMRMPPSNKKSIGGLILKKGRILFVSAFDYIIFR